MNHRQWKKNFKKVHGRNPNCWEDKRKRIRYKTSVLIDALNEIPRLVARACANVCEVLSQSFATLSERMKDVAETYGQR
jgi:hypothetical protein